MNFTSAHKFLVSALQQPWTAIYIKVIAIALLYGATVHVGNILGLTGIPWLATPLLWRSLDITLLIFDIVTAISRSEALRDRSLAGFGVVYLVVVWWYFIATNLTLHPAAISVCFQA